MQRKFSVTDLPDAVDYFNQRGYVVFRDVFASSVAEDFWSAVEMNIRDNANLQFSVYGKIMRQSELSDADKAALPRVIDIQGHVPLAAHLMLCGPITSFLKRLYGKRATCLQTLTYKFSSEQGAHSDRHLVSPPYVGEYDRSTLAAAWFAFEPSGTANGALIVYPGSHKLSKKRLDTDFGNDYGAYVKYLELLCADAGCRAESYEAQTGEVLIWHGDFVHAGGPVLQSPRPTRKSLVCHYAVVPEDRPSQTSDWLRIRCLQGSYYIPAASIIS
jgi:ectoine hydroxylase-related dioxygenase (phytanoyl-CoA dioxygenase family)